MSLSERQRDWLKAVIVGAVMFTAYNANGREIPSFDSQPTKLAARELLLRGRLSLNFVVGERQQLLERPGFQLARDQRYRSAYSPVPAIAAATITWPLWKTGIVDVRAPLAPSLMAALSASLLTAIAVALAFLVARHWLGWRRAIALALGLGLGTGFWDTVSQTLWQHETVALGLAIATLAFARAERGRISITSAVAIGLGLGLTLTSRLQLAPMVLVLLAGVLVCGGVRAGAVAALASALLVIPLLVANTRWFGTPLGAAPMLEALHDALHGVSGSFSLRSNGFAGLLVSPNRGLFVFSPIVLVAALGLPAAWRGGWRSPLAWCALAAFAQYVLYASYTVWWAGHTYGPRYLLDVLPLLVPLAAAGLARTQWRGTHVAATLLLSWSVVVAGTGAFYYPNDRWNSDPVDIDRSHERLWDWNDMQVTRCWTRGPSPQNFSLFTRAAFRVEQR